MNRFRTAYTLPSLRVPRACGDEPSVVVAYDIHDWCSPRLRG